MDHSILVHCTRYSGCSIVLAGRDIIYNVKESILKVLALCRNGKNVFRIQKERKNVFRIELMQICKERTCSEFKENVFRIQKERRAPVQRRTVISSLELIKNEPRKERVPSSKRT